MILNWLFDKKMDFLCRYAMARIIGDIALAILLVIAFLAFLAATPDSVNGDGEDVASIYEEVDHD